MHGVVAAALSRHGSHRLPASAFADRATSSGCCGPRPSSPVPCCGSASSASNGRTFAPAPNFGYQLCVERIRPEQLEGVDLSNFRVALTGAEMVRRETADAFVEAFSPFGFTPEAFLPCYGLAEATLAVTFDEEGKGVAHPSGTGRHRRRVSP